MSEVSQFAVWLDIYLQSTHIDAVNPTTVICVYVSYASSLNLFEELACVEVLEDTFVILSVNVDERLLCAVVHLFDLSSCHIFIY